ncbi:hypothetical protein RFI_29446 [Reticulomyxa filosa]|uniref:Uncharacterized protein n=1 Tax=Reticulomyxa filosa TaxID=46433 RepID=X6M252_RETFI|nr:hypothetical protein RFI_29446 [Reticulomyxa filosa]|eukprot:ETO07944.1 hypothetical protein RFI_29446 [Reticulomyxa filosa]
MTGSLRKYKDNCIRSKDYEAINDYPKNNIDSMKKYSHKIQVECMQKTLPISIDFTIDHVEQNNMVNSMKKLPIHVTISRSKERRFLSYLIRNATERKDCLFSYWNGGTFISISPNFKQKQSQEIVLCAPYVILYFNGIDIANECKGFVNVSSLHYMTKSCNLHDMHYKLDRMKDKAFFYAAAMKDLFVLLLKFTVVPFFDWRLFLFLSVSLFI